MPYVLFTHRHNFAVWAAARATQRGFTKTPTLVAALEASGIQRVLAAPHFMDVDPMRFEELHRLWCRSICAFLKNRAVANVAYGRAAKLTAVYLKSMIIVGGLAQAPVAHYIHPPIDRRLLQALAQDAALDNNQRDVWRQTNWTTMTEEAYYCLVHQLRGVIPARSAFLDVRGVLDASR